MGPSFTNRAPGADRPDGRTGILLLILAGVLLLLGGSLALALLLA